MQIKRIHKNVIATIVFFSALLLILSGCSEEKKAEEQVQIIESTPTSRVQFFDDFYQHTLIRGAHIIPEHTPIKWQGLKAESFAKEVERLQLRDEFAAADDQTKLLRAILKLSNARKDRHLRPAGILKGTRSYAPLKLYPDFSDMHKPFFYVANLSEGASKLGINTGDKLIRINDIAVEDYIEKLDPYLHYSTELHRDAKSLPTYLSAKNSIYGPELYAADNKVHYQFEKASDGSRYQATLSYSYDDLRNIDWVHDLVLERNRKEKPEDEAFYEAMYANHGFRQVADNRTAFAFYVNDEQKLALVEWYHFVDTDKAIKQLLDAAEANNALDYNLILDMTHSRGGGRSQLLLQVLAAEPFKMTFGNVRVDDVDFVRKSVKQHSQEVQDWVLDAIAKGRSFTTNEPFKLVEFPAGHDGVMQPAQRRFTGQKVALFFTWGGSNLDQFASMIADNPQVDILTMGMPTGGYSNTWEWAEDMDVPGIGPMEFEWDIGHTVRPNGEVLEGNPAIPKKIVPFTRENYRRYFSDLIASAADLLAEK